jgi:lipoprotein-anchoring transpeptidase ErfK/SrfK
LTSLHSSAADEPYLGHDGGLIGVHYNATATGNVSHGCVRLNVAAINAVNALPLGTLITFVP